MLTRKDLLVPTLGTLVKTVTAFTVGHSVTLSLAVLGFVDYPSSLIELLIALSVFVLAVELAGRRPKGESLLSRRPWLMAGLFGLLHGLGFAGALREVGLPEHEIPVSLFSFNVGIEIGHGRRAEPRFVPAIGERSDTLWGCDRIATASGITGGCRQRWKCGVGGLWS